MNSMRIQNTGCSPIATPVIKYHVLQMHQKGGIIYSYHCALSCNCTFLLFKVARILTYVTILASTIFGMNPYHS